MPSEYGNGKTANRRFKELENIGFFEKINEILLNEHHNKINLTINEDKLILSFTIMSANRNDVIGFEPTLSKINIKNSNVGRPRKNSDSVYADKIYDTKKIRKYLRNRDIVSNIPVNKRNRKRPKKGNSFKLSKDYYSVRGTVERGFGWLKMRFRKLETRYECNSKYFIAFIDFAQFFHNFELLR